MPTLPSHHGCLAIHSIRSYMSHSRRAAAVGLAGAANIAADMHIAAAHQEIGIAALGAAEPHARPGRLRPLHGFGEFRGLVFLVMRRDREQRRKLAVDVRAGRCRRTDACRRASAPSRRACRGCPRRRSARHIRAAGCVDPARQARRLCFSLKSHLAAAIDASPCAGETRVSPFQGDAYIVRASVVKALRDCGSV